ncbi:hypothetical protein CJ307_32830, partial [Klebsiella quasipneumoniae]
SSSSLSARELTKEEIDAVEVGVNKQGSLQETEIKHAKPSFHPPASSGMTLAVSVWGMPQLDVRPER